MKKRIWLATMLLSYCFSFTAFASTFTFSYSENERLYKANRELNVDEIVILQNGLCTPELYFTDQESNDVDVYEMYPVSKYTAKSDVTTIGVVYNYLNPIKSDVVKLEFWFKDKIPFVSSKSKIEHQLSAKLNCLD